MAMGDPETPSHMAMPDTSLAHAEAKWMAVSRTALQMQLRHQELRSDQRGRAYWEVIAEEATLVCARTAILLCDVWDQHWSRGATERVEGMVGQMNRVVEAARGGGVQIVHAPSDTMDFYADHPARRRVAACPPVEPPTREGLPPWLTREHVLVERYSGGVRGGDYEPPLPVDASDHGSDTGESDPRHAWHRQHAEIHIDEDADVVSDDGAQIYSFLRGKGVEHLLIMGVHTNMCVLGRSFAIRQMVRWGMSVALVRDLTDAMYNPASPPYVSHAEGTRLVIEHIEKFWCPTVLSGDILRSCGAS